MHGFSTTDRWYYLEADRTFELGPRAKRLADSGTRMRFFYVQFAALLIPPALDLLWRESLALPGASVALPGASLALPGASERAPHFLLYLSAACHAHRDDAFARISLLAANNGWDETVHHHCAQYCPRQAMP